MVISEGRNRECGIKYFQQIFTSSFEAGHDEDHIQVSNKVSADMCDDLNREFTEAEVKEALFQINPSKAPGPDGFNPFFYQRYWHVVGKDITEVILNFIIIGVISLM